MVEILEPRVMIENREERTLALTARLSANATRQRPEPPSSVRTQYQRDRDRILHSKSFRRLKHKTQVFIAPGGDHYRTRLTHTLEVTQVARTIGRALGLNEDLIEAAGLGHDLGHTPFGHAGETALAGVFPGFRHNEQSLRIVDVLENNGLGLNLTNDVRDSILHHSKPHDEITGTHGFRSNSLEGEVLRISDGVAYINHDFDDAVRAGIVDPAELPTIVTEVLGSDHAQRIDTLVTDIIMHSTTASLPGEIAMSPPVRAAANVMRGFLFERVYDPLNEQENTLRAQRLVQELFAWYAAVPERLPGEYRASQHHDSPERLAADYVASMTDHFAVEQFERLFVPRCWSTGQ